MGLTAAYVDSIPIRTQPLRAHTAPRGHLPAPPRSRRSHRTVVAGRHGPGLNAPAPRANGSRFPDLPPLRPQALSGARDMRHSVALSMAVAAVALASPGSGQACGPQAKGAAPLAGVSPNAGRGRSVHRNTVISIRPPVVRITVDEALPQAGILNFPLRNVAQVE